MGVETCLTDLLQGAEVTNSAAFRGWGGVSKLFLEQVKIVSILGFVVYIVSLWFCKYPVLLL
jgi:hypothetical protein